MSSIMADELAGLLAIARGNERPALKTLGGAAAREASRPKPIARPYPVKPAGELYAEALFALGNSAAAVAEYRRVLQRTPRRPLALLGLARAAQAANDPTQASQAAIGVPAHLARGRCQSPRARRGTPAGRTPIILSRRQITISHESAKTREA